MATEPVSIGTSWIPDSPQVPTVDDTMAFSTDEVKNIVHILATNTHVLKAITDATNASLAALSAATPRLVGSNTFVGGTLILDHNGNCDLNVVETKKGPHLQTGNSSNRWTAFSKSWTSRVDSGVEATVRIYIGDGLDTHQGFFGVFINADWNIGAQKWQHRNPNIPAFCVIYGYRGTFNGYMGAQPSGTQWTTWGRFAGTQVVNLRYAEGGPLGPLSWGSDGSLKYDNEQFANYLGQFGSTDINTMYGRGIFIPLNIGPGEVVGTITIRYNAAVGGDIFRLRKRYALTGTPAYSTIGSYTCITGTADGTISYTGNLTDITGNAEYGILWTFDALPQAFWDTSPSDANFNNKILGIHRSNF